MKQYIKQVEDMLYEVADELSDLRKEVDAQMTHEHFVTLINNDVRDLLMKRLDAIAAPEINSLDGWEVEHIPGTENFIDVAREMFGIQA